MKNIVLACILTCTFNAFANEMSCNLESQYNEFIEIPDNINLHDNPGSISHGNTLYSDVIIPRDNPDVRGSLASFGLASSELASHTQSKDLQNLSNALSAIEFGLRLVVVDLAIEDYVVTEKNPEEKKILDAIRMLGCALFNLSEFMNEKIPRSTTVVEDKEGNTHIVYKNIHAAIVHANNARKKFSKLEVGLPNR